VRAVALVMPNSGIEGHDEGALREIFSGRFDIVRELGRGGMGVVYEARDLKNDGRPCALKVLRRPCEGGRRLIRFKREFRTAQRLSNPSCVRVFELGYTAPLWWFTMELLPHGSLAQKIAEGPLPLGQTMVMAHQVLCALDHVHSFDIVHRDLKPANVLLAAEDLSAVRIADFGVAQVAGLDDELGVTAVVGSPAYLALEVVERGATDPRADLYALGVTMREALTGRPPESFQRRNARGDDAASEPKREHVPEDLPAEVRRILSRLLAPDPDDRYRTAAEVIWDIEASGSLPGPPRRSLPLVSRPYLAAPRLVGRGGEFEAGSRALEESLFSSQARTPLVLSISGVAGSGKSRLVRALAQDVQATGVLVALGECREEVGTPYRELNRILATLASAAITDDTSPTITSDGLCGGPQRTNAGELEPAAPATSDPSEHTRRQVDRAVALLGSVARCQPVLVVLEDLQWLDAASLQVLTAWIRAEAVARRQGETLRAAFIVVHRPEEVSGFHDALRDLGTSTRLQMNPLGEGAVRELVGGFLGMAPDALRPLSLAIFGAEERTPLFVKQILRILLARGLLWPAGRPWSGEWVLDPETYRNVELPRTLQDAIGDRAARLSVEVQRVLGMAAVGGRRFDFAILVSALGEDRALVLECLEEASRAGFVFPSSEVESSYLFAHDRYRDAIYQNLSDVDRAGLHRAWARALLECTPRDADVAAELAHHYQLSGEHALARHYAMLAGAAAFAASAFDQAVRMYRIARGAALALGERQSAALVERQGDACMNAGLYEQAEECYSERLAHCTREERPPLLLKRAELRYRGAKERGLHTEDVLRSIEGTLEELGFPRPSSKVALHASIAANVLRLVGYGTVPHLMQKTARPAAVEMAALCSVCVLAAEVAYFFNPSFHVFYIVKAATLAARLGPGGSSSIAMAAAAFGMAQVGLERLAREFENWSEAYESDAMTAPDRAWARLLRGISAYARGDIPRAEASIRNGCRAVERSAEPLRRAFVHSVLAFLLAERGETTEATEVAHRMVNDGEVEGMSYLRFCGHSVLAVIAFLQGEYLQACDEMAACRDIEEANSDDFSRLTTELQQKTYAVLAHRDADVSDLLATAAAYQERDFSSVHVSFLTHALVSTFLSSAERGTLDAPLLRRLVQHHATEWRKIRSRFRQQRPLLLGLEGALQLVSGRRRAARASFESARTEARAMGLLGDLATIERLERVASAERSEHARPHVRRATT
jgi:serine/threonine protein kinase